MFKFLIGIVLVAFAGNSILCRLALADGSIDAYSFSLIRIASGVAMLSLLVPFLSTSKVASRRVPKQGGSWLSGIALFVYVICFSAAYVSIASGVGALILFGTVQLAMMAVAVMKGDKLSASQWLGCLVAFSGLVYLFMPGLVAPDLLGSLMMVLSGIAWGYYTLAGSKSGEPILRSRGNFLRALPLAGAVFVAAFSSVQIEPMGVVWAVVSGAITSGLAYALWYLVLPKLSTSTASILQLIVPILASIGGVVLLGEVMSLRLVLASFLVLGGILVSVMGASATNRDRVMK